MSWKIQKVSSGLWEIENSFEIHNNEIVILLGRNGAGKTTLLNTLAGLMEITSGYFLIDSEDVTNNSSISRIKKGIRIALEGRHLFDRLTVKKNLLLGAFTISDKNKISQRLEYVLQIFPDLKIKLHSIASTLSGGQQTQLNIARALMGNPKLLLLDEPSVGLDPINVLRLLNALSEIKKNERVSILIAEQRSIFLEKFPNRILVISRGLIIYDGSYDELKKQEYFNKLLL